MTDKPNSQKPDALKAYAHITEQPVIWNDMDAFNHVNNVVYYRYAETARINYLDDVRIWNDSLSIILAQSSCNYLLPVVYPDTLLIGVRSKSIGNTSLVMEYCYFSTEQQKVVATLDSVLVKFDQSLTQKTAWTAEEREKIIALDSSVGHTLKH